VLVEHTCDVIDEEEDQTRDVTSSCTGPPVPPSGRVCATWMLLALAFNPIYPPPIDEEPQRAPSDRSCSVAGPMSSRAVVST